jgi:ABC-type lipoprotein release transport system permease subunit
MSVFLAGRSLARSNHGIAALTTIMMLLIYISLLFLPSLIQGAVNRANTQLTSTLTSNIVITPAGRGTSIDDTAAYLASIRGTAGVAAATAVYRVGTEVSYGANLVNVTVDAIDPASYGQVFSTPRNLIEGRALTSDDTTKVLLGIGVAGANRSSVRGYRASLETVNSGDTVSITLSNGRTVNFTVAGVYFNQFPQSDGNAYITQNEASSLAPSSVDHATSIYVKTRPGTTETQEVSRLEKIRGGMKFLTSADLGAAVQVQTATYLLISNLLKIISLLMAAATIITITYVDLASKRRQTGIERAIGIRSAPIVLSYVFKAWAYALVGIGAGYLLLRYAITPLVTAHPFQFPNGPVTLATTWHETVLDLIVLAVVVSVAALLPAWRAVQIRILDAIWG